MTKTTLLLLLLSLATAGNACAPLSASTSVSTQDRALTNRSCPEPFVLRLIAVNKQWYIEVRGARHRLSRSGDALRPIMEGRKSKAVLVLAPRGVTYKVLQQFADYSRSAGVTCINWDSKL